MEQLTPDRKGDCEIVAQLGQLSTLSSATVTHHHTTILQSDIDRLFTEATEYGRHRGAILASQNYDYAALEKLDRSFSKNGCLSLLASTADLDLIYRIHQETRKAQLDERLKIFQERVAEAGIRIGILVGTEMPSNLRVDAIRRIEDDLERSSSTFKDLLIRCPGLKEAIDNRRHQAENIGIQQQLDAHHDAAAFYVEMSRRLPCRRPRIEVLYGLLANKNEQELKLFKEAFLQRYQKTPLERAVQSFPTGFSAKQKLRQADKIEIVRELLSGEKTKASAGILFLKLDNTKSDFKRIECIRDHFKGKNSKFIQDVLLELDQNFFQEDRVRNPKTGLPFQSLAETSKGKFFPKLSNFVMALVRGNLIEAEACYLAMLTHKIQKNRDKIVDLIVHNSDAIDKIKDEFKKITKCELAEKITSLKAGPQRDLVTAILNGDTTRRDIAKIQCGILGLVGGELALLFDKDYLPKGLNYESYRDSLLQAYKEQTGSDLLVDLKKRLTRRHYEVLASLIDNGEISRAELLHICMLGVDPDEKNTRRVLKHLSSETINQIRNEYSERYQYHPWIMSIANTPWIGATARRVPFLRMWFPKDPANNGNRKILDHELAWKLSGDDKFDVSRYLEGTPEDPVSWYKYITKRHKHERSGALLRKYDLFSKDGVQMDLDVKKALDFYTEHNVSTNGNNIDHLRFEYLAQLCNIDFEAFRKYKIFIAEHAANLTAGFIATGIATASLYVGAPLVAACGAAGVISCGVRWGLKSTIRGDSYTTSQESLRDLVFGFIDGATFRAGLLLNYLGHIGQALNSTAGYSLVQGVAKIGLQQAAKAAGRIGHWTHLDRILKSDDFDVRLSHASDSNGDSPQHASIILQSNELRDQGREDLFNQIYDSLGARPCMLFPESAEA